MIKLRSLEYHISPYAEELVKLGHNRGHSFFSLGCDVSGGKHIVYHLSKAIEKCTHLAFLLLLNRPAQSSSCMYRSISSGAHCLNTCSSPTQSLRTCYSCSQCRILHGSSPPQKSQTPDQGSLIIALSRYS